MAAFAFEQDASEPARKSGRAPKPKWADDMLRAEDVSAKVFQAHFMVRKRSADGEAPRRRRRPTAKRTATGSRLERVASETEVATRHRAPQSGLSDGDEWLADAAGAGPSSDALATKFKERPGAWDARMQSALSAQLSRLVCSRRALEAAWSYAPGVPPSAVQRAMRVVPVLAPDVRAICAALDHNQVASLAALLADVKVAVDAACARALAEGRTCAAPTAPDARRADSRGGLGADSSYDCTPDASEHATEVDDTGGPPLSDAESMARNAAWLAEALCASLRTAEAAISQGRVTLPDFIAHNHEPYVQAEWRTTPYQRRPYVRLTDYQMRSLLACNVLAAARV